MTVVLIASCYNDLRENVKAVIDFKRDLYPITCTCKYDEIRECIEILTPQFIIVDLIADYKKGLDLVTLLKKRFFDIKVIGLTVSNAQNIMIDAFRSGVDGYLVKEGLFNELYRCVCTLLQGDKYVSLEIVNDVLSYYINAPEKYMLA